MLSNFKNHVFFFFLSEDCTVRVWLMKTIDHKEKKSVGDIYCNNLAWNFALQVGNFKFKLWLRSTRSIQSWWNVSNIMISLIPSPLSFPSSAVLGTTFYDENLKVLKINKSGNSVSLTETLTFRSVRFFVTCLIISDYQSKIIILVIVFSITYLLL